MRLFGLRLLYFCRRLKMKPTPEQMRDAWNAQADQFNQWGELDWKEQAEWVFQCATNGQSKNMRRAGVVVPMAGTMRYIEWDDGLMPEVGSVIWASNGGGTK
jgi:hypothetical protein